MILKNLFLEQRINKLVKNTKVNYYDSFITNKKIWISFIYISYGNDFKGLLSNNKLFLKNKVESKFV